MFVFLDIGFTLLGGPTSGPSRRLINTLNIPETEKTTLSELLFQTPFTDAHELSLHLIHRYNLPQEKTQQVVSQLWMDQRQEAYVLPGASEALARLKKAGISYGFISNIWPPFYEGFFKLFPEERDNVATFLSYQQKVAKPHLKLYQHALEKVGIEAKNAVMIGDTYEMDIAPANALGMKSVWILHRPEKERGDLIHILNRQKKPADLTLADINSLNPDALFKLFQE